MVNSARSTGRFTSASGSSGVTRRSDPSMKRAPDAHPKPRPPAVCRILCRVRPRGGNAFEIRGLDRRRSPDLSRRCHRSRHRQSQDGAENHCGGGFLPVVAPASALNDIVDEYYGDEEKFLFAMADCLHQEYKAIVDAGFMLQIDDPWLSGMQERMVPPMTEVRNITRMGGSPHRGAQPRAGQACLRYDGRVKSPSSPARDTEGRAVARAAARRARGQDRRERPRRGARRHRGPPPRTGRRVAELIVSKNGGEAGRRSGDNLATPEGAEAIVRQAVETLRAVLRHRDQQRRDPARPVAREKTITVEDLRRGARGARARVLPGDAGAPTRT